MKRFAAMLTRLSQNRAAGKDYLASLEAGERAEAEALMTGIRPKRVAGAETLLVWASELAAVPDWLCAAALEVSGDKAETAALLLPPATGPEMSLTEVVTALRNCTAITAHATMAMLWSRLSPQEAAVANRLASGTFRATWPVAHGAPTGQSRSLCAVMVQAATTGREVTLALRRGNELVPLQPVALPHEMAAEVMVWVRANGVARFGPVQRVLPAQIFRVTFDGAVANPRRKCGFDLINAVITEWLPEGSADDIAALTG
jgi:hypothetical protein